MIILVAHDYWCSYSTVLPELLSESKQRGHVTKREGSEVTEVGVHTSWA